MPQGIFWGTRGSQKTRRGGCGQGGCCCLLLKSPRPPARHFQPEESRRAQAVLTLPPVGHKGEGDSLGAIAVVSREETLQSRMGCR